MSVRSFGRTDEAEILEIAIASDGGAEARIITWGAALRDLVVQGPAGPQRVVLGLDTLDHYVRHSPFFGAVVGRYANRIGDARFRLGGREVDLVPNENGNELHGGPASFGRRPWSLLGHDSRRVHLGLVSEDGEGGFPGRLFALATYEFVAAATLRVTLQAISDRATPVNLTLHGYYNLDGSDDARDHRLLVSADFWTPVDEELIPTGAIAPVAGTRLDFREARPVRSDPYSDLDGNFVLRRNPPEGLAHAATLASDRSGLAMQLWTTEPGLQVYDGHLIRVPVPGLGGLRLQPYSGIALEPQRFPDAPNHAHFPNSIVEPGQVSRQISELKFASVS
jgi:aldose 1-epimerase